MEEIIYVLEDDEDIRFIVEYILIESGYKAETFGTAKDFMAQMLINHPDLILLDVMLPDGNGIEICRFLKTNKNTADIPIIIMSAHAAEKSILEEACADGFITKPFDLDQMLHRIKSLIKL